MGLWLHVSGTEPVIWSQELLPQSGGVALREGWNLVGWAGDEGTSAENAFAPLTSGLDHVAAWDAAQGQHLHYATDAPAGGNTLQHLNRGEALWVNTSAERYWLQPASAMPMFEFSAEFSASRQDELREMVNEAMGIFAHRFGAVVPGLTVRYHTERSTYACSYGGKTIRLTDRCFTAIGHEYSHAIQEYLAPAVRRGPAWLIEGVANRWSAQYHEIRGFRTYERHLEELVYIEARRTNIDLRELEGNILHGDTPLQNYSVVHLAIDFLIELAGEDRTFLYHSTRSEYESWEAAFEDVFGLTVDDFYGKFAEYRAVNFPPYPLITGTVVDHEGNPLTGVLVRAQSQEGQPSASMTTGDDGAFSLWVREGAYLLEVHTPEQEGTRLAGWYADDGGFTPRRNEATPISTTSEDITGIMVSIPELTWYRIAGVVLGPDGEGIEGVGVDAYPTGEYPGPGAETDGAGAFSMFVLGGSFGLHLYSDTPEGRQRIGTYGGETGYSPWNTDAATLHIEGQDVTGITIRLPVDPSPSQWRRIEGVVLGPNGKPQEGVSVDAYPDGEAPGLYDRTDKNGAFSVLVLSGPFKLVLRFSGDRWHWYDGIIKVGDEDVRGITIRLPSN